MNGSLPPSQSPAPPSRLALALAQVEATALTRPAPTPDDTQIRDALSAVVGRALSPLQARLLAARETERTDVRALALTISDVTPTTPSTHADTHGGLTRDRLGLLPLPIWQEAVEWLLGTEGYSLERRPVPDALATHGAASNFAERLLWRGLRNGAASLVVASRCPRDWLLDEAEVDACLAVARREYAGTGEPTVVLVTPAIMTVGASVRSQERDVTVISGANLEDILARVAVAHAEEQARAAESLQELATAATAAREKLLKYLAELTSATERASRGSGRRKAASSRAAVAEAVASTVVPLRTLAQISLAWDTLSEEWVAAFGATAARTGTLAIVRDAAWFGDLAERATHLRTVALSALQTLGAAASTGELGYDAWHAALCETFLAHWQMLRARAVAIDPAAWRDFPSARDATREAEASRATSEYRHTAARLQKARTDLATRAAIDVPDM